MRAPAMPARSLASCVRAISEEYGVDAMVKNVRKTNWPVTSGMVVVETSGCQKISKYASGIWHRARALGHIAHGRVGYSIPQRPHGINDASHGIGQAQHIGIEIKQVQADALPIELKAKSPLP